MRTTREKDYLRVANSTVCSASSLAFFPLLLLKAIEEAEQDVHILITQPMEKLFFSNAFLRDAARQLLCRRRSPAKQLTRLRGSSSASFFGCIFVLPTKGAIFFICLLRFLPPNLFCEHCSKDQSIRLQKRVDKRIQVQSQETRRSRSVYSRYTVNRPRFFNCHYNDGGMREAANERRHMVVGQVRCYNRLSESSYSSKTRCRITAST